MLKIFFRLTIKKCFLSAHSEMKYQSSVCLTHASFLSSDTSFIITGKKIVIHRCITELNPRHIYNMKKLLRTGGWLK